MMLEVHAEEMDGFLQLSLEGEMDYHSFSTVKQRLDQALGSSERTSIILDLRRVTFMDSSALGNLLFYQQKLEKLDARMALIPSPAINEVLSLTRLKNRFISAPDTTKAMEALS